MSLLVQKYGGSSLADLERLEAIADEIAETYRQGHDLVVVVSAMGDSTDDFLERARALSDAPPERELDMLLSVGERISMSLMSIALQQRGVDAVSLTGSQCGIITTHNHSNARIMDVRPFRVQDELAMDNVVVVAGYQGTSYRREVTTLGRGGSDTTAVALAAALDAEACEIYTDVSGVFSADPGVVLSAHQLAELTHEEMLEMARSGARVLNEEAVEYARRADIALYTREAHGEGDGQTVVRSEAFERRVERAERGLPAVAVTHLDEGLYAYADDGGRDLLDDVRDRELSLCNWSPPDEAEVFVDLEEVYAPETIRRRLDESGTSVGRAGLVSVVGQGIGRRSEWTLEGQRVLKEGGLSPIAVGVEAARLSWVVPEGESAEATRRLHGRFVEGDSDSSGSSE